MRKHRLHNYVFYREARIRRLAGLLGAGALEDRDIFWARTRVPIIDRFLRWVFDPDVTATIGLRCVEELDRTLEAQPELLDKILGCGHTLVEYVAVNGNAEQLAFVCARGATTVDPQFLLLTAINRGPEYLKIVLDAGVDPQLAASYAQEYAWRIHGGIRDLLREAGVHVPDLD